MILWKKWDLNIYRGVLTGFNEAFYLTQEQRDELIAKEPQAEEIIVPLLRGRYVGRYKTNWDQTWMLFIPWHFPIQGDPSIVGCSSKAEAQFKAKYPIVYGHLNGHKSKLAKRNKAETGIRYEWYALQRWAASYWQEFRKPKIIYPNMTKYMPFYYDDQGQFFGNQKCFIITSDNESLPYLRVVLNSSLFRCCFRDNFPELLGNTYEVRKVFVDKIPIKRPDATTVSLFETLVDYIQFAKVYAKKTTSNGTLPAVIAAFLEELIDACVMEIYFADHMAEKKIAVIDKVCQAIKPLSRTASDSAKWQQAQSFYDVVNAPKHPIRNRLMRIPIDSHDLLRVIKEEGRV